LKILDFIRPVYIANILSDNAIIQTWAICKNKGMQFGFPYEKREIKNNSH